MHLSGAYGESNPQVVYVHFKSKRFLFLAHLLCLKSFVSQIWLPGCINVKAPTYFVRVYYLTCYAHVKVYILCVPGIIIGESNRLSSNQIWLCNENTKFPIHFQWHTLCCLKRPPVRNSSGKMWSYEHFLCCCSRHWSTCGPILWSVLCHFGHAWSSNTFEQIFFSRDIYIIARIDIFQAEMANSNQTSSSLVSLFMFGLISKHLSNKLFFFFQE